MTESAAPPAPPVGADKDRRPYVDLLKVVLAVMVIGIHSPLLTDILPGGWTLLNQGLYRIAVPTFFCLSAYFLSDSLASGGGWRWARRILLLYVLWMTVYLPIWAEDVLHADAPLRALFKTLLFGYWHLWYLVSLAIGIPLLALLHRLPSRSLTLIAVTLCLIGTALEYGTELFDHPLAGKFEYWRNTLFDALPFLILGHLLRRHDLPRIAGPRRTLAVLLLGLALLLAEVIFARFTLGLTNAADLRLSLVVAAPALACLSLALPATDQARALIPRQTGRFANGLYFLHVGSLHIVARSLPLEGTAATLAIIALTALLTVLMLRIPLARRLL